MRAELMTEGIKSGLTAGHMAGGMIVMRILVLIILLALIVRLIGGIARRRSMRKIFGGNPGKKAMMFTRMMPSLSKEQAAGIIVNDMKKKNISTEDMRSKLINDYSIEPIIADALITMNS